MIKSNGISICPIQYSFETRFKRPHAMNIFGDMRENRILTLPHFLHQRVNCVNFLLRHLLAMDLSLAVTYTKIVAVRFAVL